MVARPVPWQIAVVGEDEFGSEADFEAVVRSGSLVRLGVEGKAVEGSSSPHDDVLSLIARRLQQISIENEILLQDLKRQRSCLTVEEYIRKLDPTPRREER